MASPRICLIASIRGPLSCNGRSDHYESYQSWIQCRCLLRMLSQSHLVEWGQTISGEQFRYQQINFLTRQIAHKRYWDWVLNPKLTVCSSDFSARTVSGGWRTLDIRDLPMLNPPEATVAVASVPRYGSINLTPYLIVSYPIPALSARRHAAAHDPRNDELARLTRDLNNISLDFAIGPVSCWQ